MIASEADTRLVAEMLQCLKDNLAAMQWAIAELKAHVISARDLEEVAERTRVLIVRTEAETVEKALGR